MTANRGTVWGKRNKDITLEAGEALHTKGGSGERGTSGEGSQKKVCDVVSWSSESVRVKRYSGSLP
jgi:hypothetical protein